VTATFDEDVDLTSVGVNSFLLDAGGPVAGTVSYSAATRTATFAPLVDLAYQTWHSATVTGVRDLAGNTMLADHVWSFETAVAPDTTPPTVVLTDPPSNEGCVSQSATITAVFSEPIDQTTVNTGSFLVFDELNQPVPGYVYSNQAVASFQPSSHLAFSSGYVARLTTEISDLAGNPLQQEYGWSYWTGPSGGGLWKPVSSVGEPSFRSSPVALWTGQEMLIWGGATNQGVGGWIGGLFDPVTDSWRTMSVKGVSLDHFPHAAVWAGNEMIVMGSYPGVPGGARYDPVLDTWSPISLVGMPPPRTRESAVWTGAEMIVWGGRTASTLLSDGGRYDPDTDTWAPVQTTGAPIERTDHLAVWTGTEMIVWGGKDKSWQPIDSGARYDPVAALWAPIAAVSAPANRKPDGVTATWTGSEMIVVGGGMAHAYDPTQDAWSALSPVCAPSQRRSHTAVWTGTELAVWGGIVSDPVSLQTVYLDTGAAYHPPTDTWRPLTRNSAPGARAGHASVWTGTEKIVWGGGPYFEPGGRLTP
jgi:hypothetical protein